MSDELNIDAAHDAGVIEPIDYAIFQNYGYMGLYGGLKTQDIKECKGLKKNQNILVHMGSTVLTGNIPKEKQRIAVLWVQQNLALLQKHWDKYHMLEI